jgi:hypothetical protein
VSVELSVSIGLWGVSGTPLFLRVLMNGVTVKDYTKIKRRWGAHACPVTGGKPSSIDQKRLASKSNSA